MASARILPVLSLLRDGFCVVSYALRGQELRMNGYLLFRWDTRGSVYRLAMMLQPICVIIPTAAKDLSVRKKRSRFGT